MTDALDKQVDTLVKKASELKKGNTGILWTVAGGFLIACIVGWLKYLLSRKSAELAKAKTELELTRKKAEQDAIIASVEAIALKRVEMEAAAKALLQKVEADEKQLQAITDEHNVRWAKVKAVAKGDWDALNKLAGVKP